MAPPICNDIALGKANFRRIHCPWMIAGHLGHHRQCRVVQVAMHDSLHMTCINQALESGETKTSANLQSPHCKQASS